MYKTIIFFAIYLISLFQLKGQDSWIKFSPLDYEFKVLLPKVPILKTKELQTELGILINDNYFVGMDKKDNNFLYTINVVKYPFGTFSKDSITFNEDVLASSIGALSENLKCKIVYNSRNDLNKDLAYNFRMKDENSGQVVKGFSVLHNDKIYTLTVFTLQDRSLNKDIDKFLQSFEILN